MAAAATCDATELSASGASGETGDLPADAVELTDTGTTPCSLQGYLGVAVPDVGGRFFTLQIVHDGTVSSHGFERGHVPARPAPVNLVPGRVGSAWLGLQWQNWCGPPLNSLDLKLVLVGGQEVPVTLGRLWPTVECQSSAKPYVLDEGPVQLPVAAS